MKRLLAKLRPRSLFGRLVGVLLAVLVTAQLLSFAIHMNDRRELLQESSGMQSAQRIADIVRLLEPLDPAERRRIAGVLSTPPMLVRLDQGRFNPPAEQAADRLARAALFGALIRRSLGDGWPVEVVLTGTAEGAPPGAGMRHGSGKGMRRSHDDDEAMRPHHDRPYFARPALSFVAQVRLHDGTLATFDTRQPEQAENWPYRMLLSLIVLLVAVMAVSWVAVRWATRPLKALADAAEELGKNINRPPLAETGPLEVASAARTFNTMQARLIRYVESRTRALAAMSHDLKTPITRMRLRAELLDDPAVRAKFVGDLAELESMVGLTLDFMRGLDTGEPVKPVDVNAILESLQANIAETGGRVDIVGAATGPWRGRPQAIKRCLANLVENAVKYGTRATVRVEDSDERVTITVRDEGPGIPEEEVERVFEPFHRLEGSRNRETGGTGLGLAIARSVAEAHGGSLTLHNRVEGGLEARLILPRQ